MSTVADVIDGIRHRLPERGNVYPVLNTAVRLIAKRLRVHNSSLVRSDLSVSVTADSSSASLPSDFWGLVEKPYIDGQTYALQPVPNQSCKLTYTSNSTPMYYEIIGTTIYLYPGSSSAITIKGSYWARPTKLTKPTDTMPFNELFDDVVQESLLKVYATGKTAGDPNEISLLKAFIAESLDDIAHTLDKPAPIRIPDAMGLDDLANEDY